MNDVVARTLHTARIAGQRRLERQLTVERILATLVADGIPIPRHATGAVAAIWLAWHNHAPRAMLEMVASSLIARLPSSATIEHWIDLPEAEKSLALALAGASTGTLLDALLEEPTEDDSFTLFDSAFGDSARRMLWPTLQSRPETMRRWRLDGEAYAAIGTALKIGMSTRLEIVA